MTPRAMLLAVLVAAPAASGCLWFASADEGQDLVLFAYHRTEGEHAVNVEMQGSGCARTYVTLVATNLSLQNAAEYESWEDDIYAMTVVPLVGTGDDFDLVSFLIRRDTRSVVLEFDGWQDPLWRLILDVQEGTWWTHSEANDGLGLHETTLRGQHVSARVPLNCVVGGVAYAG